MLYDTINQYGCVEYIHLDSDDSRKLHITVNNRVYQSNDSGETWKQIGDAIPVKEPPLGYGQGYVWRIAVDPRNEECVFAIVWTDGLWRFEPKYVYVSNDGNCGNKFPCYSSIQKAIDDASDRTAIRLTEGNYKESIVLNESKTLILQGGWDSSFNFQAPNTTFVKAPRVTKGSLTLQMLNVAP